MPTINELRQQAATIKNATQVGENTATRVGTTFETIADLLEGMGGVTNLSTIDIGSIDTLNTTGDMLVGAPNIYTLTKTIGANTFKVGTLFQFANNGRYDVAQVIMSQFIIDADGRIDTMSADQEVHIFYRLCKTMNGGSLPTPIGTWTTWTELGGSGGSGVTIDPYPTQNSGNAVSSGGVFERLQDVAPKVDISAIDDIDEYSDMLATKSPFYVVTKTLSGNVFRIGTLMEFANQGRYILYQILATDYVLNDDGTLDTTLSENGGLKLIWRMKQFSGNPPVGMTIGVWSAWTKFGDSGYQPDNEDIDLNASDQLQFANKLYDASAFSGLGRVYLRKNIVTSGGVDKNVLTQAMVNTANTIYHIQYDYDLNGKTITVPEGCVLEFEGGSLKNGMMVGNDYYINGCAKCLKDLASIKAKKINVSWLDEINLSNVDADIIVDTELSLSALFLLHPFRKLQLEADIILYNGGQIELNYASAIIGNNYSIRIDKTVTNISDVIVIDGDRILPVMTSLGVVFNSTSRVLIDNVKIILEKPYTRNEASAIILKASDNNWLWGVTIKDSTISGSFMAAVKIKSNDTSWIHDIYLVNLINDRQLYRLLIQPDNVEIQSTGVLVYDKGGAMQHDNYLAPYFDYMPQRLVKMYHGILISDGVFAWDWKLTTDQGGTPVDGPNRGADYIFDVIGGILRVDNFYYSDGSIPGLYGFDSSIVKNSSRNSIVSSYRSVTPVLNKAQVINLLGDAINNTSSSYKDWLGTLRWTTPSIRIPFSLSYSTTIPFPRIITLGYFKADYSQTYALHIIANKDEYMQLAGNSQSLTTRSLHGTIFNDITWLYFIKDDKLYIGTYLTSQYLALSYRVFTILHQANFFIDVNYISPSAISKASYLPSSNQNSLNTIPTNAHKGDFVFDGTPKWVKTDETVAILNIGVSAFNSQIGDITITIMGRTCSITLSKIYDSKQKLLRDIVGQLYKIQCLEYITTSTYSLVYCYGDDSFTFSYDAGETGLVLTMGINRNRKAPTLVNGIGYTLARLSGATEERPTSALTIDDVGYQYFDTTLGKPIYLKVAGGVKSWVDATGADV